MPYPSPTLYPEPTLYPDPGGSGAEPEPTLPAWIPSPTLVARILRTRLVLRGGVPLDDFTASTNPTRADVADVIDMVAPLVLMRTRYVGDLACVSAADLWGAVATLIAQRAAIDIEESYWPEEVGDAASVDARRQMLTDDLTALEVAIEECRSDGAEGGDGGESDSRSDPAWRFPGYRPLRF